LLKQAAFVTEKIGSCLEEKLDEDTRSLLISEATTIRFEISEIRDRLWRGISADADLGAVGSWIEDSDDDDDNDDNDGGVDNDAKITDFSDDTEVHESILESDGENDIDREIEASSVRLVEDRKHLADDDNDNDNDHGHDGVNGNDNNNDESNMLEPLYDNNRIVTDSSHLDVEINDKQYNQENAVLVEDEMENKNAAIDQWDGNHLALDTSETEEQNPLSHALDGKSRNNNNHDILNRLKRYFIQGKGNKPIGPSRAEIIRLENNLPGGLFKQRKPELKMSETQQIVVAANPRELRPHRIVLSENQDMVDQSATATATVTQNQPTLTEGEKSMLFLKRYQEKQPKPAMAFTTWVEGKKESKKRQSQKRKTPMAPTLIAENQTAMQQENSGNSRPNKIRKLTQKEATSITPIQEVPASVINTPSKEQIIEELHKATQSIIPPKKPRKQQKRNYFIQAVKKIDQVNLT